VREVDRLAIEEYGLPGVVLMENAGANAARMLHGLGVAGPVAITCGRGNNGGDGFVIARHLELLGHEVRLLLACPLDGYRGDAAVNAEVARRAGLTILDLSAGSPIAPRGAVATAITAINAARAEDAGRAVRVFAVDVPSGLDCDTGDRPGACVRADITATFVAPKPGFATPAASGLTGVVHVLDIGAPLALLARFGLTPAGSRVG